MKSTTLSVPDVSCDHCKTSIEGAVGGLDGVTTVEVDVPTKTVDLSYDEDDVSLEEIIGAIAEVGYEVAR